MSVAINMLLVSKCLNVSWISIWILLILLGTYPEDRIVSNGSALQHLRENYKIYHLKKKETNKEKKGRQLVVWSYHFLFIYFISENLKK